MTSGPLIIVVRDIEARCHSRGIGHARALHALRRRRNGVGRGPRSFAPKSHAAQPISWPKRGRRRGAGCMTWWPVAGRWFVRQAHPPTHPRYFARTGIFRFVRLRSASSRKDTNVLTFVLDRSPGEEASVSTCLFCSKPTRGPPSDRLTA